MPDACMHCMHGVRVRRIHHCGKEKKEKLGVSVASAHAQGLKWALLRAPRRTHPNHQSTLPPFTGQEKWNTATQAVPHALTALSSLHRCFLSDMVLLGPSFISPLVKGERHCSGASITYHHHHLGSSIPWPGRHVTLASAAYAGVASM
ncbi:hypothetical protein BHE74_00009500 [Ensete ventricosum]|nr:hypothetical protein GW17_00012725 [Ensete ventricosum]RWW82058.1 hypothetical protein BHE74_00009500 [Ensete ventricosum]RZR79218.1 hypothetical protein BHM03_00004860 [Ensete ventricosum]